MRQPLNITATLPDPERSKRRWRRGCRATTGRSHSPNPGPKGARGTARRGVTACEVGAEGCGFHAATHLALVRKVQGIGTTSPCWRG